MNAIGFLSWLLLSVVIGTLVRIGVRLSWNYDLGIFGPFLLVQAFLIIYAWTQAMKKMSKD